INTVTGIGAIEIEAGNVISAGTGVNAATGSAIDLQDLNLSTVLNGVSDGISISVASVTAGGDGINVEIKGPNILGYNIPGIGGIGIVVEDEDGPGNVFADGFGINAVTSLGGIAIDVGNVTAKNDFGINAQTGVGVSLSSLSNDGN